MKVLFAIPETKEEWKGVWEKNKKKVIGAAVAAGGFIAGAVLTHGKLWGNDGSASDDDQTAGYLTEGEANDEEDYVGDPDDEVEEEESNESEGDAE